MRSEEEPAGLSRERIDSLVAWIAARLAPGAGGSTPADSASMLDLAFALDRVAAAFVGGNAGNATVEADDPSDVSVSGDGVIRTLIDCDLQLDLYAASMESTRILFAADPDLPHAEIMKRLGVFWRGRVAAALAERGVAEDVRERILEARVVVDARSRPGWIDPADAYRRASAGG